MPQLVTELLNARQAFFRVSLLVQKIQGGA